MVEREEKPGKGGSLTCQVDLSAAEHVLVETHYLPTSALSSEDLRDWAVVGRVWRGEHVVHMCSLLAPREGGLVSTCPQYYYTTHNPGISKFIWQSGKMQNLFVIGNMAPIVNPFLLDVSVLKALNVI